MKAEISLYSKHISKLDKKNLIYFFGLETIGIQSPGELQERKRELPCVEVTYDHNREPSHIKLYRPIISSEDIYFTMSNGNVSISNFFKHALLSLNKKQRSISKEAIVDHFLFRAVPGKNTYCENVNRVGNGEEVIISLTDYTYERKQTVSLETNERSGNPEKYVERTNRALQKEINKLSKDRDTCLFFSGGVDSGVLANYVPEAPLVSYQVTSEEFKPDALYAKEGAEIFSRDLEVSMTDENDYFSSLEATIDSLGMPPHHAQTVLMFNALKNTPYSTYVVGQSADGLFGLIDPKMIKYKRFFKHKSVRLVAQALLPFVKGNKKKSVQKLIEQYEALSKPVNSEDGFALNFAKPCDRKLLENIFGADLVKQRIRARYDYLTEIGLKETNSKKFIDHIEASHIIDFFGEDTGTVWHQLAKSQDKEIYRPFATKGLMDTALSIPATERYISGNTVKYILKSLLQKMLPTYPATRQKLGGVLPVQKYFQTNMFSKPMDKYDFPEFLNQEILKRDGQKCKAFLWHAISFIIWENRILKAKIPENITVQPDEDWSFSTNGGTESSAA